MFDFSEVILMTQVIYWSVIIIVKPKKYIQISSLFNIIVFKTVGNTFKIRSGSWEKVTSTDASHTRHLGYFEGLKGKRRFVSSGCGCRSRSRGHLEPVLQLGHLQLGLTQRLDLGLGLWLLPGGTVLQ